MLPVRHDALLAPRCRFRDCAHAHEPGCMFNRLSKAALWPPIALNADKTLLLKAVTEHLPPRATRQQDRSQKELLRLAHLDGIQCGQPAVDSSSTKYSQSFGWWFRLIAKKGPVAPPSDRPRCRGLFQGTRDGRRLKTVETSLQPPNYPPTSEGLVFRNISMINFSRSKNRGPQT